MQWARPPAHCPSSLCSEPSSLGRKGRDPEPHWGQGSPYLLEESSVIHTHFPEEETETQRRSIPCPQSQTSRGTGTLWSCRAGAHPPSACPGTRGRDGLESSGDEPFGHLAFLERSRLSLSSLCRLFQGAHSMSIYAPEDRTQKRGDRVVTEGQSQLGWGSTFIPALSCSRKVGTSCWEGCKLWLDRHLGTRDELVAEGLPSTLPALAPLVPFCTAWQQPPCPPQLQSPGEGSGYSARAQLPLPPGAPLLQRHQPLTHCMPLPHASAQLTQVPLSLPCQGRCPFLWGSFSDSRQRPPSLLKSHSPSLTNPDVCPTSLEC